MEEDDYGDYGEEETLGLGLVVTPAGGTVNLSLRVSQGQVLNEDLYNSDRSADSEDESEYTANEGTLRYQRTLNLGLRLILQTMSQSEQDLGPK